MILIQALILGVVQGLTEFIPVSSSAHLWLVQSFMHLDVDGTAFDIVLHLGTALALIVNFWRDLLGMLHELGRWAFRRPAIRSDDRALILPLIIGTLPGVIMDLTLLRWSEQFRGYATIGATMILSSVIFVLAERKRGDRRVPTLPGAVVIGVAQGLAGLFPGLSRSGSTISAGMFAHLRRDCSARFSFLLALPIILGAGAKTLLDLRGGGVALPPVSLLAAGFLAAAVTGTVAVRVLLAYLANHTLRPFAVYLFALGAVLIALSTTGVLHH